MLDIEGDEEDASTSFVTASHADGSTITSRESSLQSSKRKRNTSIPDHISLDENDDEQEHIAEHIGVAENVDVNGNDDEQEHVDVDGNDDEQEHVCDEQERISLNETDETIDAATLDAEFFGETGNEETSNAKTPTSPCPSSPAYEPYVTATP